MRILFLLGAASRIRNFDRTILELVARGHSVCVAGRLRKAHFVMPPQLQHERITARVNPIERSDEWRDVVDLLRGARDYVRYFDPRFADATRLTRRAYEIAPTQFVLFCERYPWLKRWWRLVAGALALAETLVPPDEGFEAFLRDERPDLVVVTPLVTFESYQTDYVKAAHHLGIPVAFIPFSWDNLTNKGLVRVQPDRVLVWNDVQRHEAIELHGCRADAVLVTGAPRFDWFFEYSPATSRAEFLSRSGLDPARPMIVYLGSSQLTGPNEMELIRRWAEAIRGSGDEALRDCNILVRPHPALTESWKSVDYSDLGRMAISVPASRDADQELFDTLCHAHVAVGLNTSAMLEAAIVGRPVHTLVIPGFNEGQLGTMHFKYLVEAFGGLAETADTLDEHVRQLAPVLHGDAGRSPRSRAFAEGFLRPHGIDRAVSPILATEIERTAEMRKTPARVPIWHGPVRRALLATLRGRTVRQPVADRSVVGTMMTLRPVRMALEELQQGTAPVFIGPWVDSRERELLYWIPFVRWALATYGLAPERLIAVSNGDVGSLYGPLARRFVDWSKLFSPSELEHWARRSVPQSEQNPKQAVMYPFDREILDRASRAFDLSDYQVLHPLAFFRVMNRLSDDRSMSQLAAVLRHEPLGVPGTPPPGLPGKYVAFSLSPTQGLPCAPANVQFMDTLLRQATLESDVLVIDGDVPPGCETLPRLHVWSKACEDFATRVKVISWARALVSGFGEATILSAFCGTPAVAFHSTRLPADQSERLEQASQAGWATVFVRRTSRFKALRLPKRDRS